MAQCVVLFRQSALNPLSGFLLSLCGGGDKELGGEMTLSRREVFFSFLRKQRKVQQEKMEKTLVQGEYIKHVED